MTDERDARDTYWIVQREQILCLASARRMDIVDLLAASGPMSVAAIADALAAKPTALYHHLEKLERVGLVETRDEAGSTVYATPAERMRLMRALADPANEELMAAIVATLARQSTRDFETALAARDAETDGPRRALGFFRLVAALGPDELARMNALMAELAELFWSAGAGPGRRVALTWFLTPLERERGARPAVEEDEP